MEGDGDLNQALKKLLVFQWSGAPNVFEGFMSIEELGLVKQANPVLVLVKVHASFSHAKRSRGRIAGAEPRTKNLAPKREVESTIENPICQTRRSDSW